MKLTDALQGNTHYSKENNIKGSKLFCFLPGGHDPCQFKTLNPALNF